MFLHELSRRISENWAVKVDGEEYEELVRRWFNNLCPYCSRNLADTVSVIEHLDGMNRYRAGLHAPGNVLVACKKCNSEKRRDDSLKVLFLRSPAGNHSYLTKARIVLRLASPVGIGRASGKTKQNEDCD